MKEFSDEESGGQEGAAQSTTNTDVTAYLGSSLGLTTPSVLRSPRVGCVGTLPGRDREGKGCIFLWAGRGEGIW